MKCDLGGVFCAARASANHAAPGAFRFCPFCGVAPGVRTAAICGFGAFLSGFSPNAPINCGAAVARRAQRRRSDE